MKDLQNRVIRDVRVAYLDAVTAHDRMALTSELLQQAQLAMDLAQSRFDLGLGAIVELSQAQLNVTSAQIAEASAKYDYQALRVDGGLPDRGSTLDAAAKQGIIANVRFRHR